MGVVGQLRGMLGPDIAAPITVKWPLKINRLGTHPNVCSKLAIGREAQAHIVIRKLTLVLIVFLTSIWLLCY